MKCLSCQRPVTGREFCEDCLARVPPLPLPEASPVPPASPTPEGEVQASADGPAAPPAEAPGPQPRRQWWRAAMVGGGLLAALLADLLAGSVGTVSAGTAARGAAPGAELTREEQIRALRNASPFDPLPTTCEGVCREPLPDDSESRWALARGKKLKALHKRLGCTCPQLQRTSCRMGDWR